MTGVVKKKRSSTSSESKERMKIIKLVLVLVFVPLGLLVGVFCVGYLFVAIVDGTPPTDALVNLVKLLMEFVINLFGVLLK